MKADNFNRRRFLQSAFYSSLLYGAGALPKIISPANAAAVPLANRILVNLFLDGGPDMRHLVVPAYDATPGSFGQKYWTNRERSHNLAGSGQTAEQRYNEDFVEFVVGDSAWNAAGLVDPGGLNTGVAFGIWKEAGWLIDMFRAGNVALVFNAVGGTNRAHDLSTLMLNQGNVLSTLNNQDRSGWGGRLARSAGGKSISLVSSPTSFSFGPVGSAPNYDPDSIDNSDLLSIENTREFGLYDFDLGDNAHYDRDGKMARAAKSYYAGLRQEQVSNAYQKFMDHELDIRIFGDLIETQLETVPVPSLIQALYSDVAGINPDPNNPINDPERRVLFRTSLGTQIRNLYDVIAVNNHLSPSALSMTYGGWDTHGDQRQIPSQLAGDPGNGVLPDPNYPFSYRGIETGLRDIFGGQFGASPPDPDVLHCAFSALWASLTTSDREKIVVTIAGEFGRQIRDNGGNGTDHGKGNLMFVIGDQCQGGVYGELFQSEELPKYDLPVNQTPDIDPKTEIDEIFSKVCDWVVPGSGVSVFPRTAAGYAGEAPLIEMPGLFDSLMT